MTRTEWRAVRRRQQIALFRLSEITRERATAYRMSERITVRQWRGWLR